MSLSGVQSTIGLWDKAVESLSDEDKQNIDFERSDKLAILDDVLKAVDDKRRLCLDKRWRYKKGNKEVIIRDQLEKVVVWVDKFKQVGDSAVQYDPTHAALPWAGVRFFLHAAVSDIQTFGAMLEGVEHVSNLITRYAVFETLYLRAITEAAVTLTDKLSESLLRLYTAVLMYLSKARRYYHRNTIRRAAISVMRTSELAIDVYIEKISKEQTNVDACARLVDVECRQRTGEEVQRLKAILSYLEKPINRSATQLSDLHDKLEESERLEIFRWISSIPYHSHHKTMGEDFMPGSGAWLLQKTKFLEWRKSSAPSLLWLHGILGSGKSKLVYSVIEHLRIENMTSKGPAPIAYFYCARDTAEPERANPGEVMRSILRQLSCSSSHLPIREPVVERYKERRRECKMKGFDPAKLTLAECTELILELLESNPATIIVDALDECDRRQRHKLIKALDQIIESSVNLVKIFVSSRDDDDIVFRMKKSPDVFIRATDNGEDIRSFVVSEVERAIEDGLLLRRIDWDERQDLKSRIIDTIVDGAQGMFRWASLQIQNLCDSERIMLEEDLVAELGRLPQTLKESYDNIYNQILRSAPATREIAERAMKWLLCSVRAPSELLAAVSEGQCIVPSIDDLLGMCRNLLVFDEEISCFRFAHLSVREYLEDRDGYGQFEVHAFALERCMDILIAKPMQSNMEQDIFWRYAIFSWPVHYKVMEGSQMPQRIQEKLWKFLWEGSDVSSYFRTWVYALRDWWSRSSAFATGITRDCISGQPHPLFVACTFEFLSIVKDMAISRTVDWNQRSGRGQTCLHIAVDRENEELLRLLLDQKGIELDPKDWRGQTPLSRAIEIDFDPGVRLLLEKGASLAARTQGVKSRSDEQFVLGGWVR